VVSRRDAPAHVLRAFAARPLDAGERALDARPISGRDVLRCLDDVGRPILRAQARHELLEARQEEDGAPGRPITIMIGWNALVGLARDRGQRESPSDAEDSIARAGVIGERERGPESLAAGREPERDLEGAGPGRGADAKRLAEAPDRAAALGQ